MSHENHSAKQSLGAQDFDLAKHIERLNAPKRALVTAGMPYANGPLHLGHLAGAHIPADIHARWLGMLIGSEQVLFVSGTDDHGSATELAARRSGEATDAMIQRVHAEQAQVLKDYSVDLDVFSGTSQPEAKASLQVVGREVLETLKGNGVLSKRKSMQWFDPELEMFLQDRFVRGTCPNCGASGAYSDECESCLAKYSPEDLKDPRSQLSNATPELRETEHLWFDMLKASDTLLAWVETQARRWRKPLFQEILHTLRPALEIDRSQEEVYRSLKPSLGKHKARYAPGKKQVLQFERRQVLEEAKQKLSEAGVSSKLVDGWAHRSLSRDVGWGLPIDEDLIAGNKTWYVWPESLLAPIAFAEQALKTQRLGAGKKANTESKGISTELTSADFWRSSEANVYQFLGIDNAYFYVVMQGCMWLSSQKQMDRLPLDGELQLTEVFATQMLRLNGEKFSKSTGNFISGREMLADRGYSADQVRYFLATLGLADSPSNFRLEALEERNRFLAGPLNAAFEKPISACHSKFAGSVPQGSLHPKVEKEFAKLLPRYLRSMDRADYVVLLGAIENFARQINSLFTQFKPHDDRFPEDQRSMALYSAFFVLKNIMIMLYPFVPTTMDRLRNSLNLESSVWNVRELGRPMAAGHQIGAQSEYFPAAE